MILASKRPPITPRYSRPYLVQKYSYFHTKTQICQPLLKRVQHCAALHGVLKTRINSKRSLKIRPCDGFQLTPDGAQCRDPNGMTVAFTISTKTVELEVTAINQWGIFAALINLARFTKKPPINVGHVVFFLLMTYLQKLVFYCQKLGFLLLTGWYRPCRVHGHK